MLDAMRGLASGCSRCWGAVEAGDVVQSVLAAAAAKELVFMDNSEEACEGIEC